jgi:hypothetical protein
MNKATYILHETDKGQKVDELVLTDTCMMASVILSLKLTKMISLFNNVKLVCAGQSVPVYGPLRTFNQYRAAKNLSASNQVNIRNNHETKPVN